MKVKSESEVTQLWQTPSDPMDCSPPGSSFHRVFQARVLEWGASAFSIYLFISLFVFIFDCAGLSLVAVHEFLIAVASLLVEHRLIQFKDSVFMVHRLSCPVACGIFPDQRWNVWTL